MEAGNLTYRFLAGVADGMVVSFPKMGRLRVCGQAVLRPRTWWIIIGHQSRGAESAVGFCKSQILGRSLHWR